MADSLNSEVARAMAVEVLRKSVELINATNEAYEDGRLNPTYQGRLDQKIDDVIAQAERLRPRKT